MRSLADHLPEDQALALKLLEARAARLRAPAREERKLLASVVTFRRAEAHYALSLTELREIRPLSRICLIPGASAIVPGVVHYRGELLSLHDLAALAGMPCERGQAGWVLVAEQDDQRVGLMADDVLDVVDIEVGGIKSVPLTLGETSEVFLGMMRDRILVLDAPRLFQSARFMAAF